MTQHPRLRIFAATLLCAQPCWAQDAAIDSGDVAINEHIAPLWILTSPSPAMKTRAEPALPRLTDTSVTLTNFAGRADFLLASGSYQDAVVITLGPAAITGIS